VVSKQRILSLLAAAMMAVFAGCNSGSTANVQNPQPPAQSQVTVAVQTSGLDNGSVPVNGTVSLTATVQGSSTQVGEGVGWLLTCQANAANTNGICGTLSVPSSASGATITYTAPTSLATGSMAVEVVAFAEADQPANSVTPIIITTFDSNFQAGNYVLEAQGVEDTVPYEFAAVITLDGRGNVTGGEQTVNANGLSVTDHNLTGNYFVGGDGRGTVTINDPDTAIGTEIFTFVFLSNSQNPQALLSQVGLDNTGASATGTMALQDSSAITTVPSGSYAFVLNGISTQPQFDQFLYPIAMGGVVGISSGNITGLGDEIYGKNPPIGGATLVSTSPIGTPDSFGGVTLILTAAFGFGGKALPLQLTGYIVDASHIQLIESDNNFGWTSGIAIAQANASDFGNSSLAGPFVFGVMGTDLSEQNLNNNGSFVPASSTAVGVFAADGDGCKTSHCKGYTDTFLFYNNNNSQLTSGAQISGTLDGSYSVDRTGRVQLSLSVTPPPALNQPYSPMIILYLTDGQGPAPALVIQGEYKAGEDDFYPALGTGIAYPQSTAAPGYSGVYGLSFTQFNSSENDGTAQMNANPTANATAPTGGVTGLSDSTAGGSSGTFPFSGNFATPSASGPFAGNFLDATALQDFGMPFTVGNNTNNGFSIDYFYIDAQHGFFVETDLVNSVSPTNPPTPSGQVSFGFYAAQCAVTNPPTGCSATSQSDGDKDHRMIRK
jgi:hypothetical protein